FGAVALIAVAATAPKPRLQWPGYVCLGFAVLTKGPVAVALCGLALMLACFASADLRRRLLHLHWIAGLGVVAALAAPWFIYMYMHHGRDFVDGYLLDENIRLFASRRFGNQPGRWFYARILAVGLLPWTPLLVGRLVDDLAAALRGERPDDAE